MKPRMFATLAALCMAAWYAGARSAPTDASSAVREENWAVAGLAGPADIIVDHWGFAHIFAASARALSPSRNSSTNLMAAACISYSMRDSASAAISSS